jgi:bacillithiol biosynthesis cysteine-adding enzyme BshC
MTKLECLPYAQTGFFSQLICDYLAQKPALAEFYGKFPSLQSFAEQIEEKQSFSNTHRETLISSLKAQYKKANVELENTLVLENINSLKDGQTFTVTTGHQLNILTGPLYFIYKIVSTLNLAKALKAQYPKQNFVPVYWMASEDHDFEEVNFINFFGGKLRWQNSLAGAVGHMPTYGMGKVLDELEEHLGRGEQAQEWLTMVRKAYHESANMAAATRVLVHKLFSDEGLLILDGDDAALKSQMQSVFEDDLFQHSAQAEVDKSTAALSANYFAQVYPRQINLFYLKPGVRERIEKHGEQWLVLNTDLKFTEDQLRQELKEHPERFSPNVVLRPLYQECILPNLAYIGGGGELAYWFQLKGMFEHFKVPFPMLVLRNSALWVNQKWQNRAGDMDLPVTQFFKPLHLLKEDLARQTAPVDPDLQEYEDRLQQMFNELEDVANLTEESMLGAVNAQRQKQLKGLDNLKKKLLRAEKRKHQIDMDKVERIHHALFPKGSLQERHDNLSTYYADYGQYFIATLKANLDPLDFRFSVFLAE